MKRVTTVSWGEAEVAGVVARLAGEVVVTRVWTTVFAVVAVERTR